MKVTFGKITVSINEDVLKKSRRQQWINARVKELEHTGIDRDVLTEKFTEVYNIVNGAQEDEK